MSRYYSLCQRYMGRMVEICCHDGRIHRGRIVRVTPTHVYLTPMARPISEKGKSKTLGKNTVGTKEMVKGSEVQFFFSPFAIPLAAIAGITLIGAAAAFSPFFWW